MPVTKAEQRLPDGFQADDLGQAVTSSNGHIALISYNASPVAQNRAQNYVVFILDSALRANVASYQWQVLSEDVTTQEGVWQFTPTVLGTMTLNVTLKN
ncbi:MAG: hypothetical protein KDD63_01650, partial [Bacteroidetes bacterium]|nr:hypothetical protein [Bacteroidota bacterium]